MWLPELERENKEAKARVAALENEVSLVNWYLAVMEDGLDTKEITAKYYLLRDEHQKLKSWTTKRIKSLEKELAATKQELEKAL